MLIGVLYFLADGSYPHHVQQQGTFDNLTACINYVTAIEQTNLFDHPATDLTTKIGKGTTHQLILETTSTTNETNASTWLSQEGQQLHFRNLKNLWIVL